MTRALQLYLLLFIVGLFGFGWYCFQERPFRWPIPSPLPAPRLQRPYGMAPAAFAGFVRACNNTKIHPWRIGQTIGDHPLSVGYHKRDGVVTYKGQKLDYCAAIDVGTRDLSRPQINLFLESLAAQGFAAFYRKGGKWQGHEHIHAIYGPLKMKPQLRRQVQDWNKKRRRNGNKIYRWQRIYRHFWRT